MSSPPDNTCIDRDNSETHKVIYLGLLDNSTKLCQQLYGVESETINPNSELVMMWKWPVLQHYPGMFLQWLRKPAKITDHPAEIRNENLRNTKQECVRSAQIKNTA